MTHTNGTREQQRKHGKCLPCFAQVTSPQATEDGETWPKYTSVLTAKTTYSSAASDSGTSTDWDGCWGTQECSACGGKGHNTRNCRAKRNNEIWYTRCNRNNHCNNTCRLTPRRSSTPRYTGNYHSHPSPRTGDDHTVPPVEPHFTTRPSPMIASQGTGNLELSQMLQTILCENNKETKLKQQQKNLMANIPTFDGKDKKACLMWVNHVEHTAKQARMTFREAVTSKARTYSSNSHLKVS